ncbi:cingulin [Cucumis melo var. makuwa]|uniref:Cingulin n=1 Tax=Cucumis melo var. makuwa TaxID=1194695 RepID=A0A5D3D489_CUCMM|nr:cingulin [Cucumis melo var. makuwa]TYK18356.1 cingulin [Cucumis melo var. makuwa]
MAKKKPTRSAEEPKQIPNNQEETSDSEQPRSAMDDDSKLQSLKSLNERLLKEMVEKRVVVGDLVQTKEALELDLKRNVNEKEQVMGELSEARDGVYGLELERNVVCVYLQSRIEEMSGGIFGLLESERVKGLEIRNLKAEINGLVLEVEEEREKWRGVCCERDEIKVEFDGLLKETGDLRGKVVEMERNERRTLEEIDDLKGKCKKLLSEKKEREILNGNLTKDNELIKKLLEESGRVIEDLERKVDVKMKEKGEIEKEKNGLKMEVEKLEKEVAQLKESTFCFKQEKEENGKRISELQMRIEEALVKESGMLMEFDVLVKELQKKENAMEMLTQQRDSLDVNLNLIQEEAKSLQRTLEILTHDKAEMEEAKTEAQNIIGDLQKESSKLKEAIASLTKMSDVGKARNEELIIQIGRLRDALDEVSFERDDARKRFGDEKENAEKLRLLLKDKERRIEEAVKELDKAKIAQEEDSLNVKKEMERRLVALIGERDLMEKNLLAAKIRIDELEAKVNSAVCNSEKALALLKKTRLTVCDGYGKGEVEEASSDEHKIGEEMQPFVEHLDAIKTSFTNKEKAVEEMTRVLETERVEQQKKKSFFTIVTAATTILAAVSALYVSKGR